MLAAAETLVVDVRVDQDMLPGATVTCETQGRSATPVSALTDSTGRAIFTGLNRTAVYSVRADFPGFVASTVAIAAGTGTQEITIDLKVPAYPSLIQLMSVPFDWDQQYVRVIGYLVFEDRGAALYLHREDSKRHLSSNAVRVEVNKYLRSRHKQMNKRYVLLEGRFLMYPTDAVYAGGLVGITDASIWRTRP